MNLKSMDLRRAAGRGIISDDQAKRLWAFLHESEDQSSFTLSHVIYYFGGLVVMSSMSWFVVTAWESLGGTGIFLVAALYAICFVFVGRVLWNKPGMKIPGGVLITASVCTIPLATYGFLRMLGLWPQEDSMGRLAMEIATIAVGLGVLRFVKFPFVTFPIAFALWAMSMDLTPLLFGQEDFTWTDRKWVSMVFGCAMIFGAYLIDRRTQEDFAFWGYLFGLLAFWLGLSTLNSGSELGRLVYCFINIALILASVFLGRKVFLVFGAFGVFGYLGHLAYGLFRDSMSFPLVLSLIGLFIIYAGVKYQKNRSRIEAFLLGLLPDSLRRIRPIER